MGGVIPAPFNMGQIRVFPLADRKSLTRVEGILRDPDMEPPACSAEIVTAVAACAQRIVEARRRGASVILMYGAHLLRNGSARILTRMMEQGWLTHLATNGAGSIHDWEYSWLGRSTESVRENVATGTFGTWDETSRNIHLALLTGALRGEGYGRSLGRYIAEDGTTLPDPDSLRQLLRDHPEAPEAAAAADLLQTMLRHKLAPGRVAVEHRWKEASILCGAFRNQVPLTVHPGIGYDIITNHPMFNGAVIGRAGGLDFAQMAAAVDKLDDGVVLSVGSAIMAPQVFEKSLSCVNNVRLQSGRPIVKGHTIHVVDLQDGGQWDWTRGEPPKTNPAYYLRFCKSFSRMGGAMHYLCCDNLAFTHHLYHQLKRLHP